MVDLGKSALGVTQTCRLLGVPKSSYYDQLKKAPKRALRCKALVAQIRAVFEEHLGNYGSPRIHRRLREQGVRISRKRVAALMRQNQLVSRRKRRFKPMTTDSNHDGPIAKNLLQRDFTAASPNRVWVGDITYCATDDGWLYLAVIIDVFSRRVVGWATSASPSAQLVVEALTRAIELRKPQPGLVVHTDRGSQYASRLYREKLLQAKALPSMSRRGNCYDNAMAESFFSTLEFELRQHHDFHSHRQANIALANFIENYYNRKRMHSSVDYKSPVQYEEMQMAA